LAGDDLEQRRLARAVGPDHADDAAGGQGEAEILEQQLVAVGLGDVLDLDDLAAEPLGHLDDDLRLARLALVLRLLELLELADARLGLGLARRRGLPDPLELFLERLRAAALLALFLRQALGLLLEVGRVVALVGEVLSAIEL